MLEQLHDIEGLDSISAWPLAIGWWVVIALGMVLSIVAIVFIIRTIAFRRSWKNDALKKLTQLEKNLTNETAGESVILLSEYLRRIILQKFPRNECAALLGKKWLEWLKAHDPKEFDWETKGTLLIEIPYAPKKAQQPPLDQVTDLIRATRHWVI